MATQAEMLSLAQKLSMDIPEDEIADYEAFLLRTEKTIESIEAMEGKATNNPRTLACFHIFN